MHNTHVGGSCGGGGLLSISTNMFSLMCSLLHL